MKNKSNPVTVIVKRRVKSGKNHEYEELLADLLNQAKYLRGYLGTEIQRPDGKGDNVYRSVFRFSSEETLEEFEKSDIRKKFLEDVIGLVESDAIWEETTGLETWFDAPEGTVVAQPSRFRMMIVLIVVVYSLVLSIGSLFSYIFSWIPYPFRLLLVIITEVAIMTYVLMPWLSKKLAPWIYPKDSR